MEVKRRMNRFYKQVDIVEVTETKWQIMLDGRPVQTASGTAQTVPSYALAKVMAKEWSEQPEKIETSRFFYRNMADLAIDFVSKNNDAVIQETIKYAETDTLCYRADPDTALHLQQQKLWEPLVKTVEDKYEIKLKRVSGVIHKPQPTETLRVLSNKLQSLDVFTLTGVKMLAELSASLCIALLVLSSKVKPEKLWAAVNLEEEWQAEIWGKDSQAEQRQKNRFKDFASACEWIQDLKR